MAIEFLISQDLGISSAWDGPIGPSRMILVVWYGPRAGMSLQYRAGGTYHCGICEMSKAYPGGFGQAIEGWLLERDA